MALTIARIAQGVQRATDTQRLARHARRCHSCRRHARELGVEPLSALGALRQKAAALLPLPWLFRRSGDGSGITGFFTSGAGSAPLAERAAALVAVAALAGAGGAALGNGALRGDREAADGGRVAAERSAAGTGELQRGDTGAATDGERRGTRQTSGRKDSGPAGGRAASSTDSDGAGTGSGAPAAPGTTPAQSGTALPAIPQTDAGSKPPSAKVELSLPESGIAPPQAPAPTVPRVDLPAVPVPDTDAVTDALPGVLP
jgi:hypothetical protein